MLRMSKLTDYGTLVLAQLAVDGGLSTAGQLAAATHLGPPTVAKLLKLFAHAGLVVSVRGVAGGYRLARPPAQISAAEIIDALEGPVAITECSASRSGCDLESICRVGYAWQKINQGIRRALQDVSLVDLQTPKTLPAPDLKAELARKTARARITRL